MKRYLCIIATALLTTLLVVGCFQTQGWCARAAYNMEYNTNRFGEDYKDMDLSSPDPNLCAQACMGETQCKAWTYVKPGVQGDNAHCWLKNRVPPRSPDENCVSGVKKGGTTGGGTVTSGGGGGTGGTGGQTYNMERNTDRTGEDYKDMDLSSPDPTLCAQACMNEAKCKAWTYVKPGVQGDNARCWLKNRVPPRTPDENCVSGVKKR